ncbi:uncharacterized protein LOC114041558 [Vombatus ursinus]|uniref:uncharacterized protein LOC114041558 n=1 Tax=Vombatus ursinus TaxID=29139 RepID=UPI000FFCE8EB|nr:uncharacterized protein LOC114041558 [Vombatus ursinus]
MEPAGNSRRRRPGRRSAPAQIRGGDSDARAAPASEVATNSPSRVIRFCPACRGEVKPTFHFCPYCGDLLPDKDAPGDGSSLEEHGTTGKVPQKREAHQGQEVQRKKRKWPLPQTSPPSSATRSQEIAEEEAACSSLGKAKGQDPRQRQKPVKALCPESLGTCEVLTDKDGRCWRLGALVCSSQNGMLYEAVSASEPSLAKQRFSLKLVSCDVGPRMLPSWAQPLGQRAASGPGSSTHWGSWRLQRAGQTSKAAPTEPPSLDGRLAALTSEVEQHSACHSVLAFRFLERASRPFTPSLLFSRLGVPRFLSWSFCGRVPSLEPLGWPACSDPCPSSAPDELSGLGSARGPVASQERIPASPRTVALGAASQLPHNRRERGEHRDVPSEIGAAFQIAPRELVEGRPAQLRGCEPLLAWPRGPAGWTPPTLWSSGLPSGAPTLCESLNPVRKKTRLKDSRWRENWESECGGSALSALLFLRCFIPLLCSRGPPSALTLLYVVTSGEPVSDCTPSWTHFEKREHGWSAVLLGRALGSLSDLLYPPSRPAIQQDSLEAFRRSERGAFAHHFKDLIFFPFLRVGAFVLPLLLVVFSSAFCGLSKVSDDPSRRSDMQALGYCLLKWLYGALPWTGQLPDAQAVMRQKERFLHNAAELMRQSCGQRKPPEALEAYLNRAMALQYEEKPNYRMLQTVLMSALENHRIKPYDSISF